MAQRRSHSAGVRRRLPPRYPPSERLPLAEKWEPAAHRLAAAVRQTWLEYLLQEAYARHPALGRLCTRRRSAIL